MCILGSHNSWSYVSPTKWYMRPFHFVAKCQSKTLEQQYNNYGVRLFDLRVKYTNYDWYIAHGSMIFNKKVYEALEDLYELQVSTNDKVWVRVILEYNSNETISDLMKERFISFCKHIQEIYGNNFIFFGGRLKSTWEQYYDFQVEEPSLDDKYSSTTTLFNVSELSKFYKILKILDDWCPWIYAKLNNKKNYKSGTTKDCLFLDFINIGYE